MGEYNNMSSSMQNSMQNSMGNNIGNNIGNKEVYKINKNIIKFDSNKGNSKNYDKY